MLIRIILPVLALILTLLFGTAFAEGAETETLTCGDYSYVLREDGTAEITEYTGEEENLLIPDALDGHPVTAIGDQAFIYCFSLTSVSVPDSVTSIGGHAFYACESLTSVLIPDSVTEIGKNPFSACSQLTAIRVSPDHPTLAVINGVLFNKTDKRLVCYPCALAAKEYAIPQGIRIIGDQAFSSCKNLASVLIPDSVMAIGSEAFSYCETLASVSIPDSVTEIGANPFICCSKLTAVRVSPDHPALAVINGVLFSKADKRLVCYPYTLEAKDYAIPQGIRIIGGDAFYSCKNLISVSIPDSVTSIGDSAFWSCESLISVPIPNSVISIGNSAFYSCKSLTSVVIPDSVKSIGDSAFSFCDNLASVTILDSVTSIGNFAFSFCSSLTSVTIPESVTSIGARSFVRCPNLTLTVPRNSYAAQYCKVNDLSYRYTDSLDWLND